MYILTLCLLTSFVSSSCIFQLGGATFDFSRLIGQDLKYEIGEGPGFFRVSICSDLMDPCINGLAPTATPYFGSLYVYTTGTMCRPISKWDPLNMMIAPLSPAVAVQSEFGTGVTFLFEDPTGCNGKPMKTQYNMMCDSGSDTGHISVRQANSCAFVVNWPTKHACAYVAPGARPRQVVPPPQVYDFTPSIPVTQKPVFPKTNPQTFNFFGDFLGNATCAEPKEVCFAGATSATAQIECKTCTSCAIVMFLANQFYSAKINADVCEGSVLAGNLVSKEGLNGYIYLHSYNNKKLVKGTLDIEPYQSSKWDLVLEAKDPNLQISSSSPIDNVLVHLKVGVKEITYESDPDPIVQNNVVQKPQNGGRLLQHAAPCPHERQNVYLD